MPALLHNKEQRNFKYQTFCKLYDIQEPSKVITLYDANELLDFFPFNPTLLQKLVLNRLIGVTSSNVLRGYEKSNNTYELFKQWQEQMNRPFLPHQVSERS